MEPSVLDLFEKDRVLTFTLSNINVSYANALRRVMLVDIPTVVFRTSPHDENDAEFAINTSRLNNEILKQRLSCIPIHITDFDIDLNDYRVEVDVKNNTEIMMYVTTKDFKIFNTLTDKYLSDDKLKEIFPPDPISRQYIDFCRLRPKISENLPGEHLKMSCKFSKGKATENGSFNVASTCTYGSTQDIVKREEMKLVKQAEFEEKYEGNSEEVKFHLTDWLNLDAKRLIIPDSFDFKVVSVGVFENKDIVIKSIDILIERLTEIINIYSSKNTLVLNSDTTIPNSFDIILENEDYTIGKILEYTLYEIYYMGNKSLTFCGFRKPHPHINKSIIRLGFKDPVEKNTVVEYLVLAAQSAIVYYKKLLPQFGQILHEDVPSIVQVKSKSIPSSIPSSDELPSETNEVLMSIPGTAEEVDVSEPE